MVPDNRGAGAIAGTATGAANAARLGRRPGSNNGRASIAAVSGPRSASAGLAALMAGGGVTVSIGSGAAGQSSTPITANNENAQTVQ